MSMAMVCRPHLIVDRSLLPVKAAYFCTFAGVASLLPYLGVFMKQVGLSPTETALIYGLMPFIGALFRTLIGALVDKLCCHKVALIVCCLLSAVLHGCLVFVARGVIGVHPATQQPAFIRLACRPGGSYVSRCDDSRWDCVNGMICDNSSTATAMDSLPPESSDNATECRWSCGITSPHIDTQACLSGTSTNLCITVHSATLRDGRHNLELLRARLVPSVVTLNASMTCKGHVLASYTHAATHYVNLTCEAGVPLLCAVTCDQQGVAAGRFTTPFWTFAAILLPGHIALAPVFSLLDALTYALLADGRHYLWGRQRLWGTIGFGVFAVVSGLAMDGASDALTTDYTPAVGLFCVFQVACAVFIAFYPSSTTPPLAPGRSVAKQMVALLRVPGVPSLLTLVFMFGAYTGLIETFLYWYLQTLAHVPPQLLFGLCMAASCTPEVLVLFAAGWVVSRLGGHARCLCLVCVAYAVRLGGYSLLRQPWLVLLLEPLHGVTFALMYAVASAHASKVTPPGLHGTVQGAISALHFGVGKGVGSLLGGQLCEVYGLRTTFRAYGVSSFFVLIVYVAVEMKAGRMGRGSARQSQQPDDADLEMKVDVASSERLSEAANQVGGDGDVTAKDSLLTERHVTRQSDAPQDSLLTEETRDKMA